MKVFHVITSLDVGGAELVLARLVRSLKQKGVDNTVICLLPAGVVAQQLKELNIPVVSLDISSFFSSISGLFKLSYLVFKGKPDVMQSWLYHANVLTSLATLFMPRVSVIWGIHSNQKIGQKKSTIWLIKLGALLSNFSPKKIIYVAQSSKILHESKGYNPKVSSVIPNGFNANAFKVSTLNQPSMREKYGVPAEKLVIGCVGRWHTDKGIDVMFEAIAQLQVDYKDELFFIFAGRGCTDSNVEFKALKQRCISPADILALGECSNIPEVLATMDIFCLPSRTEAFPLALGEAMAANLYCVATDVGDVRYLTGDLIQYAKPDDPTALKKILEFALKLTPTARASIASGLQYRVENYFSEEKTTSLYFDVYTNIHNG